MSKFWKAYASVNDDIRHRLIEEGWFGKRVTPDINGDDIPAIRPQEGQQGTTNSFYGPSHQTPSVNSFYGHARAEEPRAIDLYGQPADRTQKPDMTPDV